MLIDAHTHLHKLAPPTLAAARVRAREAGLLGALVCGTSPEDWAAVAALCGGSEGSSSGEVPLYPGYGVHPWYVKELPADWASQLRTRIQGDPQAHVGEIGVDKHFPNLADIESQKRVMEEQLEIAKEFRRPVTVHCVKAQAEVMEVLKKSGFDKTSLPVVLHSFHGNLEQLDQLAKFPANIYFSINCKFNRENVMKRIPLERLLLETDSPDQISTDLAFPVLLTSQDLPVNDPCQIRALLEKVASVRSMATADLAAVVVGNTRRAFNL